jgi:hypothetical protein
MSDSEQQAASEETSTAIVVKSDKSEDAFPKPDLRGHMAKSVEVASLNVDGIALTGKLTMSMDDVTEEEFVGALLDGSGASVKIKFQPGSRAKIHASSFYSGPVKEDGFSGQNVTAIHDQVALVGNATSGVHNGRAKIYKTGGEIYNGAVKDSVAHGRGVLKAGDTAMRGQFNGGLPVGKFSVSSISDNSTYTTVFDDSGKEMLTKRSKRRLSSDEADEDEDEENKRAKTSGADAVED